MPLYEYACLQCQRRFEIVQKFSDAPLETCEACGGKVERLISAPAFQFKGTGWYVTDYARKGGNGKASDSKSESKSESKGESKSESKSDSKSESKTESKSDSKSESKSSDSKSS